VEDGYVGKMFDRSYKIDRKPAVYYLAAKGIAVLKQDARFHPALLHAYYKNKTIGQAYVQHTIDAAGIYNVLKQNYQADIDIFTRQEVAYFEDFPKTKPDLYLRGKTEYFVTLAHDTPLFLVRKCLGGYMTHVDEEGWVTDDYPTLLFLFADENKARRFLDAANTSLENTGLDDELRIGVATTTALYAEPSEAIWTFTGDSPRRGRLTDA
jgi:hypothetical protein